MTLRARRRLKAFFFALLRDEFTSQRLERVLDRANLRRPGEMQFTNDHLAGFAAELVDLVLGVPGDHGTADDPSEASQLLAEFEQRVRAAARTNDNDDGPFELEELRLKLLQLLPGKERWA